MVNFESRNQLQSDTHDVFEIRNKKMKYAIRFTLIMLSCKGCILSEPSFFSGPWSLHLAQQSPHEHSSHVSGHHLATVRRAGLKRGARFESSEALAEQPAVARSAVELHRCCARVSRAAALLSQHIDGVTRAGSAGTKSGSSARSLRTARLRDQL